MYSLNIYMLKKYIRKCRAAEELEEVAPGLAGPVFSVLEDRTGSNAADAWAAVISFARAHPAAVAASDPRRTALPRLCTQLR